MCEPLVHGGLSVHRVHDPWLGELHAWLSGDPHHHMLLLLRGRIATLLHYLEGQSKI